MVKSLISLKTPRDVALRSASSDRVADGGSEGVVDVASNDGMRAGRIGLWALAIGFGGFLLWAAFAPLDEGVPASAQVTIDTKSKAVQHLTGGIIKKVMVREGEWVKEGQPLFELDNGTALAVYEQIRQQFLSQLTIQDRLLAEQSGAAKITHSPEVVAAQNDPTVQQRIKGQDDLLRARRAALAADISAMQENVQGQEATIRASGAAMASRKEQQTLLREELSRTRPLVEDGYAPKNRLLDLDRLLADNAAMQADTGGQSARAQQAIAELRQRMLSRKEEYRKEVETQLAEVTGLVEANRERVAATAADLARMEIRSPATGQVVGLAVQSVGGVIQPGQKLMDVSPNDEPLLLEAHIDPHLIDKVRAGLEADVRFSAFAKSPQLVAQGIVTSVSRDLFTDPRSGATYFVARVQLTTAGMKALGKHQLQPGMPAEIVIKTGERTLLNYLLHPLAKRMAASLKEE